MGTKVIETIGRAAFLIGIAGLILLFGGLLGELIAHVIVLPFHKWLNP